MPVTVEPTADVLPPLDALEALLPGLADAVVDLLDALHDRIDELGPARPDLLAAVATELAARWPATAEADRPLAVLDALRALLLRRAPGL